MTMPHDKTQIMRCANYLQNLTFIENVCKSKFMKQLQQFLPFLLLESLDFLMNISKGFGFIEGAEQNGYGLNTGLSEITDDILLLALDMFERAVDCLLLEVDALLRRLPMLLSCKALSK